MLVLSRTAVEGKNMVILTTPDGLEIRVMVASIDGGQVRLGFNIPREVRALRGELEPVDDNRGNK